MSNVAKMCTIIGTIIRTVRVLNEGAVKQFIKLDFPTACRLDVWNINILFVLEWPAGADSSRTNRTPLPSCCRQAGPVECRHSVCPGGLWGLAAAKQITHQWPFPLLPAGWTPGASTFSLSWNGLRGLTAAEQIKPLSPPAACRLDLWSIDILFVLGGLRGLAAAAALHAKCQAVDVPTSIIAIPKSIDNHILASQGVVIASNVKMLKLLQMFQYICSLGNVGGTVGRWQILQSPIPYCFTIAFAQCTTSSLRTPPLAQKSSALLCPLRAAGGPRLWV